MKRLSYQSESLSSKAAFSISYPCRVCRIVFSAIVCQSIDRTLQPVSVSEYSSWRLNLTGVGAISSKHLRLFARTLITDSVIGSQLKNMRNGESMLPSIVNVCHVMLFGIAGICCSGAFKRCAATTLTRTRFFLFLFRCLEGGCRVNDI